MRKKFSVRYYTMISNSKVHEYCAKYQYLYKIEFGSINRLCMRSLQIEEF